MSLGLTPIDLPESPPPFPCWRLLDNGARATWLPVGWTIAVERGAGDGWALAATSPGGAGTLTEPLTLDAVGLRFAWLRLAARAHKAGPNGTTGLVALGLRRAEREREGQGR